MEQMVWNRVRGEMRGRVWNRWCGIVYGWGARSCMEQVVSNHVWGEMRGRVWNRWCRIMYGVRCEVVYGTGGVES